MVLLNDAVTGAQTESGSLPDGLGGVKRFEDALRLPQARPGIREFERELSAVHAQSDVERAAVDFFESVDGVRNELQKNQEQMAGIAPHPLAAAFFREIDPNLVHFGDTAQVQGAFDHRFDV